MPHLTSLPINLPRTKEQLVGNDVCESSGAKAKRDGAEDKALMES
jgi:hypothetical protein